MLWEPESPRTLGSLVKIIGGLCGLLKDEVYAAITDPLKKRSQMRLALLADELAEAAVPGLDHERFADAFAQTVSHVRTAAGPLGWYRPGRRALPGDRSEAG